MSNLEELIEKLCPDGVEYKTIRDICKKIASGGTPTASKSEYYNGYIPWLRTQEVDWKDILDTEIKITELGYNNSSTKWIPKNCVIVAMYGATAAKVAINKIPLTTNQACCNLEIDERIAEYKYVYYWLCKEYINLKSLGQGSQHNINANIIKNYKLPVPPLEVQREIVRILDNFTFLTTELAAELAARQKQYEFYRDFLLNFNDGCEEETNGNVRLMKLGELGKWSGGKTPSMAEKSFWENGSIPWISSKDMKFNTLLDTQDHITQKALIEASMTLYPANSIAVVTRSGILKHTFPVAYIPFPTTINQDIKILVVNDEILPRYAFHVIQSKGKDILEKTKKQGGTVDSLDFQKVLAFKVLVPTKSIQQKLVDKLDRFDALCNDISSGLPAEIEMRQKQYEYYRDKLLTFKELKKEHSRNQQI